VPSIITVTPCVGLQKFLLYIARYRRTGGIGIVLFLAGPSLFSDHVVSLSRDGGYTGYAAAYREASERYRMGNRKKSKNRERNVAVIEIPEASVGTRAERACGGTRIDSRPTQSNLAHGTPRDPVNDKDGRSRRHRDAH